MAASGLTSARDRDPSVSASAQPIGPDAERKRMLIIVNPYATTVSDRLKNLVVYALQARYDVDAVDTEAAEHAIEIGREAGAGGYDVVVAFGGDGTLNEVANGLAGSDVPLSVLPGGSTNVVARTLGIPNDVVDATENLIGLADDFRPRRIDLGLVNGRHFVFSCGMGLDATAVKRVDAHPRMKARVGPWYFAWAGVSGFYREYIRNPVEMSVELEGTRFEGITTVVQNSDPFTYFRGRPVRICDGAALDNGTLSLAVLRRGAQRDMPTVIGRALSDRLRTTAHRQIDHAENVTEALVQSTSVDSSGTTRPLPVQVDGDYIGDFAEVRIGIAPRALSIVA